jgi:hypothetical protein
MIRTSMRDANSAALCCAHLWGSSACTSLTFIFTMIALDLKVHLQDVTVV